MYNISHAYGTAYKNYSELPTDYPMLFTVNSKMVQLHRPYHKELIQAEGLTSLNPWVGANDAYLTVNIDKGSEYYQQYPNKRWMYNMLPFRVDTNSSDCVININGNIYYVQGVWSPEHLDVDNLRIYDMHKGYFWMCHGGYFYDSRMSRFGKGYGLGMAHRALISQVYTTDSTDAYTGTIEWWYNGAPITEPATTSNTPSGYYSNFMLYDQSNGNYFIAITQGNYWVDLNGNYGETRTDTLKYPAPHILAGNMNDSSITQLNTYYINMSFMQGQWQHMGFLVYNGDLYFFSDGILRINASENGKTWTSNLQLYIGVCPLVGSSDSDNPEPTEAGGVAGCTMVDEIRWSNSARYLGNYTVPTASFEWDNDTEWLSQWRF